MPRVGLNVELIIEFDMYCRVTNLNGNDGIQTDAFHVQWRILNVFGAGLNLEPAIEFCMYRRITNLRSEDEIQNDVLYIQWRFLNVLSVSLNVESIIEIWADRIAINLDVEGNIQAMSNCIQRHRLNVLRVELNLEITVGFGVYNELTDLKNFWDIQADFSNVQYRRMSRQMHLNVELIDELDMHFRFATLNDDQDIQMNVPYIQQHRVNLPKMSMKVKTTVTSLILERRLVHSCSQPLHSVTSCEGSKNKLECAEKAEMESAPISSNWCKQCSIRSIICLEHFLTFKKQP